VVRFGDFLCGFNAQCAGIEFSVFKSEKELCESLEQPKEQIDAELETCEYFLLILGGKNDEFALDKLNRAIERYAKTHGNPDVHIFVNAANKDADKVISYFASEQYEHYVDQFKHHDTLKAKFLIWLSAKQEEFAYEVDADIHGTPVIKVGGVPVSGLLDPILIIPAYIILDTGQIRLLIYGPSVRNWRRPSNLQGKMKKTAEIFRTGY